MKQERNPTSSFEEITLRGTEWLCHHAMQGEKARMATRAAPAAQADAPRSATDAFTAAAAQPRSAYEYAVTIMPKDKAAEEREENERRARARPASAPAGGRGAAAVHASHAARPGSARAESRVDREARLYACAFRGRTPPQAPQPKRRFSETPLYLEVQSMMQGKTMDEALQDPYDKKAVITNLRSRRLHGRSGALIESANLKLSKYGPRHMGGFGFGFT